MNYGIYCKEPREREWTELHLPYPIRDKIQAMNTVLDLTFKETRKKPGEKAIYQYKERNQ